MILFYMSADKFPDFSRDPILPTAQKKEKFFFFKGIPKVRIFKSNMQGRSDSLSFNETDGEMHMMRKPILWMGAKQVTGDEIRLYSNPEKEITDSIRVLAMHSPSAKRTP